MEHFIDYVESIVDEEQEAPHGRIMQEITEKFPETVQKAGVSIEDVVLERLEVFSGGNSTIV